MVMGFASERAIPTNFMERESSAHYLRRSTHHGILLPHDHISASGLILARERLACALVKA